MSNVAAEFGLLAGLCSNPEVYFTIQQHLSVNDFSDKANQKFFIVLQRVLMNAGDELVVTTAKLLEEATALGIGNFYEVCRDGELIESCLDHEATEKDTLRSFTLVKRETVKGSYAAFIKKMGKYLDETSDNTNEIIGTVDEGLITLSNKLQGVVDDEIIHLPERAHDIIMDLAKSPGELGLPDFGFSTWQRAIGGMRNGSVTFIAATAKAGKSQIGARAAIELSEHIPVLYCDSELNEIAQSVRAFGMFGEINYEILETGYWDAERDKIIKDGYSPTFVSQCKVAKQVLQDEEAWNEFRSRKLYYKKMTGMTAREMIPFLKRWVMQNVGLDSQSRIPRCLIVWDYIKLARVDEVRKAGVGAHDILGDACSALHDFAEDFNLPILAFGQTNRTMDKDLNMIAGAKKIVELVDSVSLFHKKDAADLMKYPTGTHEMHILASRYGKGFSTHLNLDADLSIGKFKEMGVAKYAPAAPANPNPNPLPVPPPTNKKK